MRLHNLVGKRKMLEQFMILNLVRQLGRDRSFTKEFFNEVYEVLMTYTLPFALRESDLEEDEVLDYIHDFYVDLQDNRVKWVDGVRQGTYDLERLDLKAMKPVITKFFFQYVVRATYMEGQWADRRVLGRRTQAEVLNGSQAPHHQPPSTSYEMHLRGDCEQFLNSLSEDESLVLNQLVREDSINTVCGTGKSMSRNKYYKVLNRLQIKAKEQLM